MRLVLAFLVCFAAAAQTAHQEHHPPQSAREYADHLEVEERAKWQEPERVVKALALGPGEIIADIGAGTGYFTRRFAPHVNKVLAVDIEEEMLNRAAKSSPDNVETVLGAHDDPKLPAASVDTVFICNVLHHVQGREEYYEKLASALKPGGRIVIIDFYKSELPVGPPPSMKLTKEEVMAELAEAGFRVDKEHSFLRYQYFLEFRR